MTQNFFANEQVIHDTEHDQDYRLLWVSPSSDLPSYWICLSSSTNVPSVVSLEDLSAGISAGKYSFAPDNWRPVRSSPPGENSLKRRDRAWSLIKDAVASEPDVYDPAKRMEMLKEIEASSGVQVPNLYKYLGKYWKAGKIPDALLPDYSLCGKTKDLLKESAKKPGRKKVSGAEGKKLTAEDIRNFRYAINKYYLGKEKISLNKTFKKMIQDCYTVKDSDGNITASLDPDDIPSRDQFLYWHRKNCDPQEETEKRNGKRKYDLENKGGTGKTETQLYGPGTACQIDATVADIYLVSEEDRTAIIGRPAMYFQMDSCSHMVMGMNITLDSPSPQAAALTILNSIENKVDYCAKFGITIKEEDWPCMHFPSVILGDRGEMESRGADILAGQLGITIENAPPYRGDLKGIIESHFHTINFDMQDLPGKMQKDAGGRCAPDYRLEARLTLKEFTAIIIRCVLQYNNYHYMKDYRRNAQMRQLHVPAVPREIWNYGIRYRSGGLRTMNREYVRYCLLPKGEASVTRQGIRFSGRYYSCEYAEQEKWYDMARTEHSWKLTAAYDPHDASLIYISPSAGKAPLECHLLAKDAVFGDGSTAEADALEEDDRNTYKRWQPTEDYQDALTGEFCDEIVKNAEEQMPGHIEKSKAARIAAIKQNREQEKRKLQEKTTADSMKKTDQGAVKETAPQPDEPEDPLTQVLREALIEKQKRRKEGR